LKQTHPINIKKHTKQEKEKEKPYKNTILEILYYTLSHMSTPLNLKVEDDGLKSEDHNTHFSLKNK